MKDLEEPAIFTGAKRCASISLIAGTGIFLMFAISGIGEVMILGAFYILLAALINGVIFTILVLHLIGYPTFWRKILLTALLMLSNIPIAIFFAWLSIQISELNHIKL